jgi:hypothetical protein
MKLPPDVRVRLHMVRRRTTDDDQWNDDDVRVKQALQRARLPGARRHRAVTFITN